MADFIVNNKISKKNIFKWNETIIAKQNLVKSDLEHKLWFNWQFILFYREGPRRLGVVRGRKPSPLPRVNSKERHPSVSPDRLSNGGRESPAFNRNGRFRKSFDEGRLSRNRNNSNKLCKFAIHINNQLFTNNHHCIF